jgi:hypothetical protein
MSLNSKVFSERRGDSRETGPDAGGFFRSILVWSFDRGTLQYDIICALILAFIFLIPRSCLVSKAGSTPTGREVSTEQRSVDDTGGKKPVLTKKREDRR